MKIKTTKTRLLVFIIVAVGFILLSQTIDNRCSKRPEQLHINSVINIHNLYPWPGAKIPFACHVLAFLKSPFAPKLLGYNETVFKENGFRILGDEDREGVVIADLSIAGDLFPVFNEPMQIGELPVFAKSVSLYVDGKELEIGHISYRIIDLEFKFVTILNPFLLPGKHISKIVLLLPSGETLEYEWQFEITWW